MTKLRPSGWLFCAGLAALGAGCSLATDVDRGLIGEPSKDGTPRGVLGGYQDGLVWGWAEIIGQEEPVTVRIAVDGTNRATIVADGFRPDLVIKGLHPTGEAGFTAEIGAFARGAEIRAFVVGTGRELTGSPLLVP